MHLNHKVNIDLLEFCKLGKFDYLELGKTKEWIFNNFPNPDDCDAIGDNAYQQNIWLYGNIELHFHEDLLYLIFSDYLWSLDSGPSLELNKWIFSNFDQLKLGFVIEALIEENIAFNLGYCNKEMIYLDLSLSKVRLSFHVFNKAKNENLTTDDLAGECLRHFHIVSFSLYEQMW